MLTNFFLLLLLLFSSDCFHHFLSNIYHDHNGKQFGSRSGATFFVGSDLGTNCLQTLSGNDNTSRSKVAQFLLYTHFLLQIIEPKPIGGNLPLFLMIMSRYSEASVKRINPFV